MTDTLGAPRPRRPAFAAAAPDHDTDADFHKDRVKKAVTDFEKSVTAFIKQIRATPLDHAELREANEYCAKMAAEAFSQALKTPA